MRSKIYQFRRKKKVFSCLLLAALFFPMAIWGQTNQIQFDTSGSIDWVRKELNAQASFNLAQAGIRLPVGRLLAEETLNEAYPGLLRPYLLSVRLDSGSTLRALVDKGEVSLEDLDRFSREVEKVSSLSTDLSRIIGMYTVSLGKLSSFLNRHRQALEPQRPLIPVQTPDYTGIIIIANEELPVRGRRSRTLAEPCLFPKIWDTEMNLIYERNMYENRDIPMVRYTTAESIFRPTPSGLDGELAALAGPNPLRIIAREIYGIYPTDPVIDRLDALKITSSDNNRRLLKEGRVVFVLNNNQL